MIRIHQTHAALLVHHDDRSAHGWNEQKVGVRHGQGVTIGDPHDVWLEGVRLVDLADFFNSHGSAFPISLENL